MSGSSLLSPQITGKRTKSASISGSIEHMNVPVPPKRRRLNSSFCGTTEFDNSDTDIAVGRALKNSVKNYMGVYKNFMTNEANDEDLDIVRTSGGMKYFVKI